jgi:ADP-ribose pyrophosphatase YjhB (NUDIX family)
MPTRQTGEHPWLTMVKQLHGIGSTGLHFCAVDFDRERYDAIVEITTGMLAEMGQTSADGIRGIFADVGSGYATPRVDVRGAVRREREVLLVREKLDGLWTLPGGYAEIGMSPSENVVKEIREEACIDVTATRLYGVFHKARPAYDQDPRDFYKLFFICEQVDNGVAAAGAETMDAGFFRSMTCRRSRPAA